MGIKTSAAGKSGKKLRRRQGKSPAPVQTLFNTCNEIFADSGFGFVPKLDHVQRLCSILDDLKPADVGLCPELPYFRAKKTGLSPAITYLHIHECEKFSIGIFCLPAGGVLPLHNHPGMSVFSKLLFGTMHIKSYDWETSVTPNKLPIADDSEDELDVMTTRLARLKVNTELIAPCKTSVLYPNEGGNMHCVTAMSPCAMLDVLTPPYSDPDGRHCTYYREFPFEQFSVEGMNIPKNENEKYAWLSEKERPEDLVVEGGRYSGPKIVKT